MLLGLLLCFSFSLLAASFRSIREKEYFGMCDASAAIATGTNNFLVACDEDNLLRLYQRDQPGLPVRTFDFGDFLRVPEKSQEADLEGAAQIGDRVYWIGSHGRSREGKTRPARSCLFAIDLKGQGSQVELVPTGMPYRGLLSDLLRDSRFARFGLERAAQLSVEEPDSLNIEGLAATPSGALLIGFRSPVPKGKALVISLLNPDEVLAGKGARFGEPMELDLGGGGIRDLVAFQGGFLVIGSPTTPGQAFQLYHWDGLGSASPRRFDTGLPRNFNAEALLTLPGMPGIVDVLSDDGTRLVGDCPCKDLPDAQRKRFRSLETSVQLE